MLKSEALREQANHELGQAKAVAEKAQADNREMTAEEFGTYRKHFEAAAQLNEQRKTAINDEGVLSQAKALADELGIGGGDLDAQGQVTTTPGAPLRGKSLGAEVIASAEFKAMMSQFSGGRVPETSKVHSAPIGFKALITGAADASAGVFLTPEQTGILEMLGRRPLTIRDLISVRRTASDAVEFVRQVSHTNAAAPVPEATTAAAGAAAGPGGYKPEGAWTFERATATVKTIAEWVPATKRALADVAQLEGLINDELIADLAEAEELQVLAGDGTGENLTGIFNTSGIQALDAGAATLDVFAAIRRAQRLVRTNGRSVANAVLLNPVEAEIIDNARENGTTGAFLGGGPFGAVQRTVWGVPIVESEGVPEGSALIGDFSKAVLWDREQANVTFTDSHSDFFVRNLVAILAEERVAFAVTRPSAFVEVTF